MNVTVYGGATSGVVDAIPSKSYAHRIAICNYLSGKDPKPNCSGFTSKDIEVTVECLRALMRGEKVLDCGESGSTLRFMLPLVASKGGEYTLVGHGRLMDRPNDELFKVLSSHGVSAVKTDCIKVTGKLTPGRYEIRGDISSQYVSGLLLALPTLKEDSEIVLTTPLVSAPYVDITLEVLSSFGVEIARTHTGFKIKGNSVYDGDVKPEGDWSNAAFFLALGAIAGDITVKGLNLNSVQGDKKILEVLKAAGAKIDVGDGITVKKSELNAFTLDAEDCPDIVPISAVVAAYAKGVSVIDNVQRLKIKESDRIESTINTLKAFGIRAESDGKKITVYGGQATSGKVNSYNDHRVVMSAAVLASGAKGSSVILDAQAVNKSYPTFFEDYKKVKGKIDEC